MDGTSERSVNARRRRWTAPPVHGQVGERPLRMARSARPVRQCRVLHHISRPLPCWPFLSGLGRRAAARLCNGTEAAFDNAPGLKMWAIGSDPSCPRLATRRRGTAAYDALNNPGDASCTPAGCQLVAATLALWVRWSLAGALRGRSLAAFRRSERRLRRADGARRRC